MRSFLQNFHQESTVTLINSNMANTKRNQFRAGNVSKASRRDAHPAVQQKKGTSERNFTLLCRNT